MPNLEEIRECVAAHRPKILSHEGMGQASVALILEGSEEDPRVLFIERARREGDPWSGQMAFPGGRASPEDDGLRATAERETREEVGIELGQAAFLGRIDDQEGRPTSPSGGLLIGAYVYRLETSQPLAINHEVNEAFWFPVRGLLESRRHVYYRHPAIESMRFPGIALRDPDQYVVWGLTYRFLEIFFEIVGHPLPARSSDLKGFHES